MAIKIRPKGSPDFKEIDELSRRKDLPMTPSNFDLKPSPTNPGPINIERVWTICELIIYRYRDRKAAKDSLAYKDCSAIADEIREVRLAWEKTSR